MSIVTASRDQYLADKELLRSASAAYYTSGDVIMADADYDALVRKVAEAETAHPDWTDGDTASTQVASGADVSGDIEHSIPMLSLDNVYSPEEFAAWSVGLTKRLGDTDPDGAHGLVVEPKMDGLAMCLRYVDGDLVQMVTRGDGFHGEDVTFAIDALVNVPKSGARTGWTVQDRPIGTLFTGEVRGEVIFTRDQFAAANDAREAENEGEKDKARARLAKRTLDDDARAVEAAKIEARVYASPFTNARNGVVGALRGAKDRDYTIAMSFVAYDVADHSSVEGNDTLYRVTVDGLERLGFTTARSVLADAGFDVLHPMSTEQVADVIAAVEPARAGLPFGTDGIVVKVNSLGSRAKAGTSSRAPHWAVAYKFPPDEVASRLEEVIWQVGRTGVITPRARIAPVFVGGTTITYATLHNVSDIARKGFLLGDHVLVKRAGEVIPRLEAPIAALRDGTQTEIVAPSACPRCGGPIDTSQSRWRCEKGRDCGLTEALSYAVGRDALDIEGLGKTQVANLVASGSFIDLACVFEVGSSANVLIADGKIAPANAAKIVAEIERARSAPLARIITACGIRGTGRSMSRRLASHFVTMDALRAASVEELAEVDKIGDVKAGLIVEELAELGWVIDRMAAAGVLACAHGAAPEAAAASGTDSDGTSPAARPLEGLSVCVTGTMVGPLAGRSRTEVQELIESLGARAASSVSKSTSILLAGDKAGSKVAKAESLGVQVMTEDEFAAHVGL